MATNDIKHPSHVSPHAVDKGMYYFILGDMSVFAAFFAACLWEAGKNREAFLSDASTLSVPLGLINTIVLLWSSYCVAMAVIAGRTKNIDGIRKNVRLCLLASAVFVTIKLIEYSAALYAGHGLVSSPFFSYYFVMTGLHLLHIVIGSTLLCVCLREVQSGSIPSSRFLESSAAYWHMVDLLWLLIYSLLYIGGNV